MTTLRFHNSGRLDPLGFKVMGLSVKEGDDPFGRFGTGLKYAICGILRLGGEIRIDSDGESHEFATKEIEFRGQTKQVVTCNGDVMGFTTHVGSHWEAWQLYRELFSNARDEGGGVSTCPVQADTVITVKCQELADVHDNWGNYFLGDRKPLAEIGPLQIFNGPSTQMFFQGLAVGSIGSSSNYTYNLKEGVTLSEDRILNNAFRVQCRIGKHVSQLENKGILSDIIASDSPLEAQLNFCTFSLAETSQAFRDVVKEKRKKALPLQYGIVDLFKGDDNVNELLHEEVELTEREKRQLQAALDVLKRGGYNIQWPIAKIESSGDDLIYGLADTKNKRILLRAKAFEHGQFELCTTVLEEHAHLETGHKDMTRGLQDWLMRQIITQICERNEEVI
jgi:hypothetical protein